LNHCLTYLSNSLYALLLIHSIFSSFFPLFLIVFFSALTNELRILKDAQTTLKSLCDKFKGQLDLTRDELHNTRLSLQQSTSNSSSLEAELIKSKSKVVELESVRAAMMNVVR
jgi:hypothetical protein